MSNGYKDIYIYIYIFLFLLFPLVNVDQRAYADIVVIPP